ncbi:MAG: hypothetical protein K2M55_02020 [Muribaculaceae bacterium]|nr:hypothetical protein [Muribaculaceae bacterium]
MAQKSTNLRPKWVGNAPKSPAVEYYFVEVHSDASSTLPGARSSVKQEIASNVERTDKVTVSEVFEDKSTQRYDAIGNASMNSTDSYQLQLNVQGDARPIKSRRIDEYWELTERGGKSVLDYHALYAVERNGANADFSRISSVSSYGVHSLWRSAIIPGWGQFYKGSNLKGGLILGGAVVCAGGIIYTENMRQDYMNKIKKTHNTENIRAYKNKADNFALGRNICIGALAAVYVYNIVDAVVAPGARHIVIKKNTDGSGYAILPSVSADGAAGVYAQITF